MKKFDVLHAFGILCLCTTIDQSSAELPDRRMGLERLPLAGDYKTVGSQTEGVMLASRFAYVSALALPSFVSTLNYPEEQVLNSDNFEFQVLESSQQVVAGLNYKLTIAVFETGVQNSICVGGFKVIVYNHFGDLSVSDWVQILTSDEVTLMIGGDTEEGLSQD